VHWRLCTFNKSQEWCEAKGSQKWTNNNEKYTAATVQHS
jgi:hypothetical protein